jgi:predicted flap endonuclease-1-like 5' DNA nuclease
MSDEHGQNEPMGNMPGSEGCDNTKAPGQAACPPRSKGQSLVEAFRQARINQRPALRIELRESRAALHQTRLEQLGRRGASAVFQQPEQEPVRLPSGATEAAHPPASAEAANSVFATFCVAPTAPAVAPMQGDDAVALAEAPPQPAAPTKAAESVVENILPLSVIGFGPGMTIRMSQLGIETVSQLAAADPDWLRASLGDLSQLVHAELWIASARKACGTQA